jgi:hypothetical protein
MNRRAAPAALIRLCGGAFGGNGGFMPFTSRASAESYRKSRDGQLGRNRFIIGSVFPNAKPQCCRASTYH